MGSLLNNINTQVRAIAQGVVDSATSLIYEMEAQTRTAIPRASNAENRLFFQIVYGIYLVKLHAGIQLLREQEAAGRELLSKCFIFTLPDEAEMLRGLFLGKMMFVQIRWRRFVTETSRYQELIMRLSGNNTFTPLTF